MAKFAVIGNLYLHGVPEFKLKDGDGIIEVSSDYPGAMPYDRAIELWHDYCEECLQVEREEIARIFREDQEKLERKLWEPIEELYRIQDALMLC